MEKDFIALLETFERDGFVYIPGFMTRREMQGLEANLARFIQEIVPALPKTEAMYEDCSRPETLKQIGNLQLYDPFFAELLSSPKIIGLAEALLRDTVIPDHVQYFSKPPGIGKATPPHQDGFYFCFVPNEALTVWIALDDIGDENGPLHYVKGSHKRGVLRHAATYALGFSQGLQEGRKTELGEEVTCRVQRGDGLVHHSLMIHSAGANPSRRQRRAISFVYHAQRAKLDEEAIRHYQESLLAQRREQGVE